VSRPKGRWTAHELVRVAAGVGLLMGVGALAQYPGRVSKTDKTTPVLRSVAVLEWTGEAGKPSASRLVPVAVYDGEQLNDGTIYLNRPEPLALSGGVEYELQKAGMPTGLFDVFGAGEIEGVWQGFGVWKPLTASETIKAKDAINSSSLYGPVDAPEDSHPVLKRKHSNGGDSDDSSPNSGSGSGTAGSSGSSDAGAKTPAATDDPDRPTLKRKTSDTGSGAGPTGSGSSGTSSNGTAGSGTTSNSTAGNDPDEPTLKRKSSDAGSSTGSNTGSAGGSQPTAPSDPDRPTIRRHKSADAETQDASTAEPDPDRPRLKHGKPAELGSGEAPKLVGFPPTMQQVVAVSDARNRADHPWKYTWANADDEEKMKSALEAIARTALGMDAPAPKPVRKTAAGKTSTAKKAATPTEPPPPAPLGDEQFRVFELAYGAPATLVLTASTPKQEVTTAAPDSDAAPKIVRAPGNAQKTGAAKSTQVRKDDSAQAVTKATTQKYVTIIAQPDLYGGVAVLYKSVTDEAHLDETPRMRLIDAVDAMGDNRAELLFELRSASQRRFVMYRVLRGSAEQLFATVGIP